MGRDYRWFLDREQSSYHIISRVSRGEFLIDDDGKGFDVNKVFNKNGLGLSHIEARIKVMKGVFNINSKRGEGTSIFISAPIYTEEVAETG